ncbi:MAG: hypothetical protein M3O61_03325 [Gemmatimonadota bacterium]|nr:hypothetical protein [Gemmatimonadota bacterium]
MGAKLERLVTPHVAHDWWRRNAGARVLATGRQHCRACGELIAAGEPCRRFIVRLWREFPAGRLYIHWDPCIPEPETGQIV